MRHLALLLAAAAGISSVALVFAHAEPARVSPGDGAVLNEPPLEVVFEMTQEMARQEGQNDIDVFDANGNEVTTIAAVIDNANRKVLSVPLPSALQPGEYTVEWKTLSAEDGDPDSGSTSFTFDPAAATVPGQEVLREDLLNPGESDYETTGPPDAVIGSGGGEDGVTWVLVAAVGALMFVFGAGSSFFLVQKRA